MAFIADNFVWILTTAVSLAFGAGGFAMAMKRKVTIDDVGVRVDTHEAKCPMKSEVAELGKKIEEFRSDIRRESSELYYPKAKGEVLEAKIDFMSASISRIESVVMKIYERYQ